MICVDGRCRGVGCLLEVAGCLRRENFYIPNPIRPFMPQLGYTRPRFCASIACVLLDIYALRRF